MVDVPRKGSRKKKPEEIDVDEEADFYRKSPGSWKDRNARIQSSKDDTGDDAVINAEAATADQNETKRIPPKSAEREAFYDHPRSKMNG